jgi:hypothetical protein
MSTFSRPPRQHSVTLLGNHPLKWFHPSQLKHTPENSPSIYFLMHPAIYHLMLFVRVPTRIPHTDPGYLATIIDRTVPVFVSVYITSRNWNSVLIAIA